MERKGFTLIELLIVVLIMAAIGSVSLVYLSEHSNLQTLTSVTSQVGALLRQAQSDSMTEEQGAQWGVHLDATTSTLEYFSMFSTPNGTYGSSTLASRYALPPGVCFATSSVPAGSSTNIIFAAVSGVPTASATILLNLMSGSGCSTGGTASVASSVARGVSGKIFFDDFNRANL